MLQINPLLLVVFLRRSLSLFEMIHKTYIRIGVQVSVMRIKWIREESLFLQPDSNNSLLTIQQDQRIAQLVVKDIL